MGRSRLATGLLLFGTARLAVAQEAPLTVFPTYQPYPFGGRTATMGGAGIAAGRDSAMPLLNPAGLAQLDRQSASLSASAHSLHALDVKGFFSAGDGGPAGEALADDPQAHGPLDVMHSQTVDAFPTSFVYSWAMGEPLGDAGHQVLSLAVLLPHHTNEALRGRYAFDAAGSRVDWLISQKTESSSHHLGPAYGVQLTRNIRLGAALFGVYDTFLRRQTQSSRLTFGAEGHSGHLIDAVDAWSLGGRAVAGVQVDLPAGFQLGMMLQSPTLHVFGHLEKDTTSSGRASPGMKLDGLAGPDTSHVVRLETDDFETRLPLHVGVGVGYERKGRFSVALDAHYVADSEYTWAKGTMADSQQSEDGTYQTLRIRDSIQAQDNWVVDLNAGAEIFLTELMALRLGAFTDLSPAAGLRARADRSDLMRRKINLYGATAGLGFVSGSADFTVGIVWAGGVGDLGGMKNPVNPDPEARFPVVEATETRLTAIVTGGVTFGEALAPVTRGLEHPAAALVLRFRREPPRTLALSDVDTRLSPLERGPRDPLAHRVDAAGRADPLTYEVVGDKEHDALFLDVARLQGAVVVLTGCLGRGRHAVAQLRERLAERPPDANPFDVSAPDATLWRALQGDPEQAAQADFVPLLRELSEESRTCRIALEAATDKAGALASRGAALLKRVASEGDTDAIVAIAVAIRQSVRVAGDMGRTAAELGAESATLFGNSEE